MKESKISNVFTFGVKEPQPNDVKVSYSQYTMYANCPHQWKLNYMDGNRSFDPSIHLVFGTAMHEVLQEWLDTLYNNSIDEAAKLDLGKMLYEHMVTEYKKMREQTGVEFSNSSQMEEFLEDGIAILNEVTKNRVDYFNTRHMNLVAIELPIYSKALDSHNVYMRGFLDLVFEDTYENKLQIWDIKTSTNGWKLKYVKDDEDKQFQLILYKKYFAEQFGVPIENIDIEFFITRRKVYEEGDFPQKRFQMYSPPSGKIKTSRATKAIEEFMSECFVENKHTTKEMHPNPSKWNCTFCPYKEDKQLCGLGASF